MSNPIIAYKNVYTLPNVVSITATSEETGYPKENAYDWLTYDGWQPSLSGSIFQNLAVTFPNGDPQPVDYFYILSQDAYLYGTEFSVQWSDDGSTWASIVVDTNKNWIYLRDKNSTFKSFTQISHAHYRIIILANENYILYSEEFDNAAYTSTATVTANQSNSHLGELVSDKIEDTSAVVMQSTLQAVTVPDDSGTWQCSLYIRGVNTTTSRITIDLTGGTSLQGYIDITWATKTVAAFGTAINEGIEQIEGTNIYRIWFSLANNTSGNTTLTTTINPASTAVSELGYIYAYGLQIRKSGLKESPKYIKTTTDKVTNPHGSFNVIMIGNYLELEQTLPVDAGNFLYEQRDNVYINNISNRGTLLGKSLIKEGIAGTINFRYITPSWFRDNWTDFMDHAEQKPFVFVPDPTNYPDEAILCYLEGKQTQPRPTSAQYLNASLKIRGFR